MLRNGWLLGYVWHQINARKRVWQKCSFLFLGIMLQALSGMSG